MLVSTYKERCEECSGRLIDLEDEIVCASCGSVMTKEIVEAREDKRPQAIDFTKHALGSYLGPLDYGYKERFSKGFSTVSSTFSYLKMVSDHSCRGEGAVYACAKLIERVCEMLPIPKTVLGQAVSIARSMVEMKETRGEFTTAVISTFSLITACRIYGITSVGVKDVVMAHRNLGHRVKTSTIIQMSLESPIKLRPRRAEEYLSRAIAHLTSDERLALRIRSRGLNWAAYCRHLFEIAKEILAMTNEAARGGHSPYAMAATSVYAAEVASAKIESRRKFMTQSDVGESTGVAEYTIREQYGEIFRPRIEHACDLITQNRTRIYASQTFQTRPPRSPVTV